jgi:hypothetical protein
VLLAVIAAAFLVLHIAAGLILQNALMTPSAAMEETTAPLHD